MAVVEQLLGEVEEVQAEVDQRADAAAAVDQLMADTQKSLREGRTLGLRASQAMLDSYATLVSGVLIGMSDALQQSPAPAPEAEPKPAAAKRTARR